MGDKIAILGERSTIRQIDTPERILAYPVDDFVDDFIGTGSTIKGLNFLNVASLTLTDYPTLSVSDKQQIVQELQKHIGGADKDGIVKNFLSTLAENNRLGVLQGVVEKFGVLMGAHRGEVELTVTSAAVRCL